MATHHFEKKVSGGKLVVADITDDGRTITDATISGDFFLEPEAAFDALSTALIGAPVSSDTTALQSLIDAALERVGEHHLHGFTTYDIAQVARRAVVGARDLSDYEWTIYRPGPLPTPVNVALDQYLLEQVPERGPMLRFWDWEDRAVVFGSYQSFRNELDPEGLERHGIVPVRRISGGGAMFMEGGNCVTYSLYLPEEAVAGLSYVESYEYLDQWVLAGLRTLSVDAWYVPINDITSAAGKIGGAAQKRARGGVLHHTTMSYDIDAAKMSEVLRVGKVKLSDKGIRSAAKRVDPLRSQTGVSREEVIKALLESFQNRYSATLAELPAADIAAAEELVKTKFGTPEWTHRVP